MNEIGIERFESAYYLFSVNSHRDGKLLGLVAESRASVMHCIGVFSIFHGMHPIYAMSNMLSDCHESDSAHHPATLTRRGRPGTMMRRIPLICRVGVQAVVGYKLEYE
jgi:hypothetical protein